MTNEGRPLSFTAIEHELPVFLGQGQTVTRRQKRIRYYDRKTNYILVVYRQKNENYTH